jgi:hypothetical protein
MEDDEGRIVVAGDTISIQVNTGYGFEGVIAGVTEVDGVLIATSEAGVAPLSALPNFRKESKHD